MRSSAGDESLPLSEWNATSKIWRRALSQDLLLELLNARDQQPRMIKYYQAISSWSTKSIGHCFTDTMWIKYFISLSHTSVNKRLTLCPVCIKDSAAYTLCCVVYCSLCHMGRSGSWTGLLISWHVAWIATVKLEKYMFTCYHLFTCLIYYSLCVELFTMTEVTVADKCM